MLPAWHWWPAALSGSAADGNRMYVKTKHNDSEITCWEQEGFHQVTSLEEEQVKSEGGQKGGRGDDIISCFRIC